MRGWCAIVPGGAAPETRLLLAARGLRAVAGFGTSLEVPIFATIDPAALVLMLAASLAVFRFKVGMLPVLAACSAAGVIYFLAARAIA